MSIPAQPFGAMSALRYRRGSTAPSPRERRGGKATQRRRQQGGKRKHLQTGNLSEPQRVLVGRDQVCGRIEAREKLGGRRGEVVELIGDRRPGQYKDGKSAGWGKSVSVRVNMGGRRRVKKK